MKLQTQICKNCLNQYESTNGNQSYCCKTCKQEAYYKRYEINRPFPKNLKTRVNQSFTPITGPDQEIQVKPLPQLSHMTVNGDNFNAVLEQMNKTHQAQMEAMETRLKSTFAQTIHENEIREKETVILRLTKELKEKSNNSDINTNHVLAGLSNVIAGIDLKDLLK